jgi:hypothetical protein
LLPTAQRPWLTWPRSSATNTRPLWARSKRGLDHALIAGHLLLEAKQHVRHGEWLPWLCDHCGIPERTAQVYMRLARRMPKNARPADLTITQALEMVLDADGDLDAPKAFPPSSCDYPTASRPPIVLSQCADCGLGTIVALEYFYFVQPKVWRQAWDGRLKPWHQARGQQILCIACLENRLGRMLSRTDFVTDQVDPNRMSDRLLTRLTAALPAPRVRKVP